MKSRHRGRLRERKNVSAGVKETRLRPNDLHSAALACCLVVAPYLIRLSALGPAGPRADVSLFRIRRYSTCPSRYRVTITEQIHPAVFLSSTPSETNILAENANVVEHTSVGEYGSRGSRNHRETRQIAKYVRPSQSLSCTCLIFSLFCQWCGVPIVLTSIKIGGLRSLLPEKLINPARVALDNPGEFKPERLATYLQTAAKSGSQDVEKFKQDWHSDDVRELWHTVNANDLPQGGDAWPLEYGGLLQDTAAQEQPSTTANEAARDFQPPSGPELVQLVDEFRARHPEMKIDVLDGANPLPIDIQVAQLDLRVEERRSAIGIEYIIIGKPGTESFSLRNDVLQSISESKDRARLATLLVRIAPSPEIGLRSY